MFEESKKITEVSLIKFFSLIKNFQYIRTTIVQQYALQKSKWSKIYAKDIKRVTVFQFQLFVLEI